VIRISVALLTSALTLGIGAAWAEEGSTDPAARASDALRAGREALERGRFEDAAAELASAAERFSRRSRLKAATRSRISRAAFTAARGAFSTAFGTPKTAMMQSPRYLSTVAPWRRAISSRSLRHEATTS
jgi:hypothetical protein